MQDFRVLCHEPYGKLVTDTAPHIFFRRPRHLRIFHYNDEFMCDALFVLRQAATPMKNTTASNFVLMVWQARYLFEKCRIAKIQGYGDPSTNTVPRLAVDEDYNERIEKLMHSLKAENSAVLLDLDDIFPYTHGENDYAGNDAGPPIASVGTRVTATELAQHQDNLHADSSIQDPHRDHRIACATYLESYNSDDAASILLCGHIVGELCMTAWLKSANAQAASCPHCKHNLCPPLESGVILPTPEQMHYSNLRGYHHVVEDFFSYTMSPALEVYGAKTAMKWGSRIMSDINKDLRRNSSRFRIKSVHFEGEGLVEVVTLKRRS